MFQKMDYGSEKNKEVYGSSKPPEYNFKASDVPTVVFHGLSDHIVDTKDVEWFLPKLPNVLTIYKWQIHCGLIWTWHTAVSGMKLYLVI